MRKLCQFTRERDNRLGRQSLGKTGLMHIVHVTRRKHRTRKVVPEVTSEGNESVKGLDPL